MSKTTVVIAHGSFGNVDENWIPYLKTNLLKENFDVIVPQFPLNDEQNLENWKSTFYNEVGDLSKDMILVGHSIAPAFLLSLLGESKTKVKAILLISAFLHDLGVEEFDLVNHSFTHAKFNWDLIKNNFTKGYSFHGKDDPYVPLWMGEEVAGLLNIPLEAIDNGGHLNISAGFQEFPELLYKILEFSNI